METKNEIQKTNDDSATDFKGISISLKDFLLHHLGTF